MPHAQRIDSFYQVARNRDFSRNFAFRVTTVKDRGVQVVGPDDLVYITAATLPGRTIQAIPLPYMGLDFQLPGSAKYTNAAGWSVTFRADGSNIIRSLFERWTFLLFDDATSAGTYRMYDDSTITLQQVDQDLNPLPEEYKLHGVFPTTVGDLSYDMTGNGDPVNLDITFAYQFWEKLPADQGGGL